MKVRSWLWPFKHDGRVCVRCEEKNGYRFVAGGTPRQIISKFGDCRITMAFINTEGILILYVDPSSLPFWAKDRLS